MCGIFAAINGHSVTTNLMAGLKALSYRGYDSAGIVVIGDNGLERRRAKGKLDNLKDTLTKNPVDGNVGIAHTRWATHGAPNTRNAHPHMTSKVAVAHNGIIENYQALREELENEGYYCQSDTDSEVIPLLITRYLDNGLNHKQAVRKVIENLDGSYAIAAIFKDHPDILLAARNGSPLVIGQGSKGFFLASDANALASRANKICYLEDGDLACITYEGLSITSANGHPVERKMYRLNLTSDHASKQGYEHYMLKEIFEQPEVVARTIEQYIDTTGYRTKQTPFPLKLDRLKRLSIVACGTSYYAAMVGKYWLEKEASLPTDIDVASESRYREAPIDRSIASLFISQSGETADTLAALRHAKLSGQTCLSILNVSNSSMAHESDLILKTLAGQEIGVASTKAYTAQLAVLLNLTLAAAYANRRIDLLEQSRLITHLQHLPKQMQSFLQQGDTVYKQIADKIYQAKSVLYLGRGIGYPLALEGALKLKEISYIHAEAYPAGELKHGPIALVDEKMPVVIVAPPSPLFDKTLSNLREVAARGAKVIMISNQQGINNASEFIDDGIVMPDIEEILQPILYSLPLQLLAYHVAVLKGTDVDQPRNLAKSVTVE